MTEYRHSTMGPGTADAPRHHRTDGPDERYRELRRRDRRGAAPGCATSTDVSRRREAAACRPPGFTYRALPTGLYLPDLRSHTPRPLPTASLHRHQSPQHRAIGFGIRAGRRDRFSDRIAPESARHEYDRHAGRLLAPHFRNHCSRVQAVCALARQGAAPRPPCAGRTGRFFHAGFPRPVAPC